MRRSRWNENRVTLSRPSPLTPNSTMQFWPGEGIDVVNFHTHISLQCYLTLEGKNNNYASVWLRSQGYAAICCLAFTTQSYGLPRAQVRPYIRIESQMEHLSYQLPVFWGLSFSFKTTFLSLTTPTHNKLSIKTLGQCKNKVMERERS